ncbi:MATE family efflux transporter [Glaciecola petra]|uniref:MATE family efflux transporter n=1 Tax=Glaciecola petra TaxID=3075602 RepID=UPI003D77A377
MFAKYSHHRLLTLAFPLIIANITTPILGLVDTAILGRMEQVHYLAGAAVGSLIVTQVYWVCGFIKMSITGLSAQAKGKNHLSSLKVLVQGVFVALVLAFFLLLSQGFILSGGLFFAQASPEVTSSISDYFSTRIFGAPAALANLVFIGWLIGQQKTRKVLLLQVLINLCNILASLLFVYVFGWGVKGVAAATVFAEYFMLLCALALVNIWSKENADIGSIQQLITKISEWLKMSQLKPMLHLNSHIFIRNLALQFTLAFITLKGVQYGASFAAVNAIILQFFALIALGLDGIANAVEALVGEEKGRQNAQALHQHVKVGLFWSSMFALVYAVFFYFLDDTIVGFLTHHDEVKSALVPYGMVILLLPLAAHWCFLLDGVFVGLSAGKLMRNSMLVSTLFAFLPTWWVLNGLNNMSLWIAMLVFLACRGLVLGGYYVFIYRQDPNKLLRIGR